MSPRRDIFFALSCCCLALSFLGIQARNLPETAVNKRDVSDWFDYLFYDDSDSSEETTKTILACSNCTVLVQPLPAGGAAPGSTTNDVAPGASAAPGTAVAPPSAAAPAAAVPPVAPGAAAPPGASAAAAPPGASAAATPPGASAAAAPPAPA